MATQNDGSWGPLLQWPLIGIHSVVTQDGKVLTFGSDQYGAQGSVMYHDLWDPVTGVHTTLNHHTDVPTDIFCAAAIILPGTDRILIAGGDARPLGEVNKGVNDVNFFENAAGHEHMVQASDGAMTYARWYPTVVSMPSGQVVIFGGIDVNGTAIGVPEIYTPGEGWRVLGGALDPDVVYNPYYPKAWVGGTGEIFYFANEQYANGRSALSALDLSGNGSIREVVAALPFDVSSNSPSIMYEAGKVLISDRGTGLWTMDITGAEPVFEKVGTLAQDRNYGNMTVLADGTVLFNGGTGSANLEAFADKTATIWNPVTNTLTDTVDEINPRLYHSTSVLLADGSVLSLGGGSALIKAEHDYLDGQIYKPPYLYDETGELAVRPVVSGAPKSIEPGDTFSVSVDDAASIVRVTFVKTGAATHNLNMDARMVELDFNQGQHNTLQITLPENVNDVTAGSWMLFVWNDKGVPSVAPLIAVQPTLPDFDGIGDVTADYFHIGADVIALDQIDFGGTAALTERLVSIDESGTDPFHVGAPADDFAVRYTAPFNVPQDGTYTFFVAADNEAQLFVDGVAIFEGSANSATGAGSVTIDLASGQHDMELRYFDGAGPARVDLEWSGPGFSREQMTFDGAVGNLLVNGSFEVAGVSGSVPTSKAALPGWSATSNFEIWHDGVDGVQGPSGNTFVEIGANSGPVWQTVVTEAGVAYALAFDYAGRTGALATSTMQVLWNDQLIATITPASDQWQTYRFDVVGTGGDDKLSFRSLSDDVDGIGGLLDGVTLSGGDDVHSGPNSILFADVADQTQFIHGDPVQHDTFTIAGSVADYQWGKTEDGNGYVVWNATGFDILFDVETISFSDLDVSLHSHGDAGSVADITGTTQHLTGVGVSDTFAISGSSSSYNWNATLDSKGIVVWNTAGHDVLYGFETLKFLDRTIDLTGTGSPMSISDDPTRVQHLMGTPGIDTFVINANSSQYGYGPTEDGKGVVVWSGDAFDVLNGFEKLRFNDVLIDL